MATNMDVVQAWLAGNAARSGNLRTDGGTLYSYWHQIGHTVDGRKIAVCCHYSMTTARHCSAARGQANAHVECTDHGKDHGKPRVPTVFAEAFA